VSQSIEVNTPIPGTEMVYPESAHTWYLRKERALPFTNSELVTLIWGILLKPSSMEHRIRK
jgi:hypothetical protein